MKKDNLKTYIHLGHNTFDKNLFTKINARAHYVKPVGGFWASPVDTDYGWKDWVHFNDFELYKYDRASFKFKLKPNAKILCISSAKQLKNLPKIETEFNYTWVTLDFEKLAEQYDAMEVLISKDEKLYWDLYGWDCDTLLIFNPDIVEEVE